MDATNPQVLTQIAQQPIHAVVQVASIDGETIRVAGKAGTFLARRAASCLLQPEVDDRVLVSGELPDALYVIAVLERAADKPQCLALGEGVAFSVVDGKHLTIAVTGKLALRAGSELALDADELVARARQGTLLFSRLRSLARDAVLTIGHGRLIGDLVESTLGRLMQFAGASQRTVAGVDQVRSGNIDYRAEQTMNLQAQNLLANADKLVRVDGEQIHLG